MNDEIVTYCKLFCRQGFESMREKHVIFYYLLLLQKTWMHFYLKKA